MSRIRQKIAFGHDLIMTFLSLPISMFLRMGTDMFAYDTGIIVFTAVVFTAVAGTCFLITGLYGGIWRYVSLNDVMVIAKAVTLSILIFVLFMFMLNRLEWTPRSTPIINWFVLVTLLGAPRFLYRQFKDSHKNNPAPRGATNAKVPVLLVGAADGAEMFVRAIGRNPAIAYQIVGIIGEKSGRVGRNIHGVQVLGTIENLSQIYNELSLANKAPQRIIITKENIEKSSMQKLINDAETLGVSLSRMPKLTDFRGGVSDTIPVRPIAIEDVLGRAQLTLDKISMGALVKDRRVMITGAGGTIGSELSSQIAAFDPSHLSLLDSSEFALYSADLKIKESYPNLSLNAVIADVRDKNRISQVFRDEKPDLVFHAAALKHVPIVEAHPSEGVLTNINGTRIIADCCHAIGVRAMVLISTDKAVNPANIMGASKRIAETYCQALDLEKNVKTRFVTVRFGNVLGSTGSVVPLFQHQIANGGPLTVTHRGMKRFFMTVREAVELVLESTVLGIKPDSPPGHIYVLDMGKPIKISDLARQMILLSGRNPDKDIKIEFTGLRPGEKLFEEILHDSEPPQETDYPGVLLAAPRTVDLQILSKQIEEVVAAASSGDTREIFVLMNKYVPEFQSEGGDRVIAASLKSN
ncbi:MAG: nucleotide sugar dehydratase [Rhodospirillaceae bacterium]|nr:nucleotide sugar dehydratase [Rhodospirillaceae bacterium]